MAYTDRADVNYLGNLFLIGANQTPFLNMIGGLTGGKSYNSFQFPLAQPWSLSTATGFIAAICIATFLPISAMSEGSLLLNTTIEANLLPGWL